MKRVLLDRENDSEFIEKLKAMEPDIIVDLVNFNIKETKKIVEGFGGGQGLFSLSFIAHLAGRMEWQKQYRLILMI